MTKITIEHSDGTKTVIENALDWQVWDSDDVDGIMADYKFELPENEYPKFYEAIHHKCFKLDHSCEWDDFVDIVTSTAKEFGCKDL